MVKDRINELRVKFNTNIELNKYPNNEIKLDVISDFLKKVECVQKTIETIEEDVFMVNSTHLRILSKPGGDYQSSNLLDEKMRSIKGNAAKTRLDLKILEDKLESDYLLQSGGNDRIKHHQYSAVMKRFTDVMSLYNKYQLEYRSKCKERIQLQLQIAGACVSDQRIEEMIDSLNPSVFTEAILEQTEEAQKSLMEIEARCNDILKLERSIDEVRELFQNVAVLVDQQGDLINNIEHSVMLAVDKVDSAGVNINQGVINKKKVRRRKVICAIISAILVILLIAFLASLLGLT